MLMKMLFNDVDRFCFKVARVFIVGTLKFVIKMVYENMPTKPGSCSRNFFTEQAFHVFVLFMACPPMIPIT